MNTFQKQFQLGLLALFVLCMTLSNNVAAKTNLDSLRKASIQSILPYLEQTDLARPSPQPWSQKLKRKGGTAIT